MVSLPLKMPLRKPRLSLMVALSFKPTRDTGMFSFALNDLTGHLVSRGSRLKDAENIRRFALHM